jgi:hypothetical protein
MAKRAPLLDLLGSPGRSKTAEGGAPSSRPKRPRAGVWDATVWKLGLHVEAEPGTLPWPDECEAVGLDSLQTKWRPVGQEKPGVQRLLPGRGRGQPVWCGVDFG